MRSIRHFNNFCECAICEPQLKQTAAFDWRNTLVGDTQIVCHSLMMKFGEKETSAFAKAIWYSPIKAIEIIIFGFTMQILKTFDKVDPGK